MSELFAMEIGKVAFLFTESQMQKLEEIIGATFPREPFRPQDIEEE